MTRIAIIGGSGFGDAFVTGSPELIETEYGEVQITRGPLSDTHELIFLARHGKGHSVAPHLINHRANILALQALEVSAIFATTAVGSLRTEFAPGDFVVLSDFIDFLKGNVVTFFDEVGAVAHTDLSEPYSADLRSLLLETAPQHKKVHQHGTYVCASGPRYETPAEIRLFASWGGDVVGMTSVPESVLCREVDLAYASVSVVTNYGCGLVTNQPLSHAEVEAQMAASRAELRDWLLRAAERVL